MDLVSIIKSIEGTEIGAFVALVLALLSAMAHALFGAIVKSGDPLLNRGAINICYGVVAAPFALFVFPLPTEELWPVIALMYLVHLCYEWFQVKSFQLGAFVLVYPIGRGFGPLLIALAAVVVFDERLSFLQWFGILLISGGIFTTAFVNLHSAKASGENIKNLQGAIGFALLTGVFVAIYTTVDAYGVRLADNPFTFLAWFFFTGLFGSPIIAFVSYSGQFKNIEFSPLLARGMLGAAIGVISFGAVMLATRLGQVATVAAIRETSIIFGTALGVFLFKEAITPVKLLLIGLIALGAICVEL